MEKKRKKPQPASVAKTICMRIKQGSMAMEQTGTLTWCMNKEFLRYEFKKVY